MAKVVSFEGNNYSFPDDATSEEIGTSLKTHAQHPSMWQDVKTAFGNAVENIGNVFNNQPGRSEADENFQRWDLAHRGITGPEAEEQVAQSRNQSSVGDYAQAALGVASSPLQGANRNLVSRPVSRITGLPMEGVEAAQATLAGIAGAGEMGMSLARPPAPKPQAPKPLMAKDYFKSSDEGFNTVRETAGARPAGDIDKGIGGIQNTIYKKSLGDSAKPVVDALNTLRDEGTTVGDVLETLDNIKQSGAHPKAIEAANEGLTSILAKEHPDVAMDLKDARGDWRVGIQLQLLEDANFRGRLSGDTSNSYVSQINSLVRPTLGKGKNKFTDSLTPELQKGLEDIGTGETGGWYARQVAKNLGNGRIVPAFAAGAIANLAGLRHPWIASAVDMSAGAAARAIANRSVKSAINDLHTMAGQQGPLYNRLNPYPQTRWGPPQGPPAPPPMLPPPSQSNRPPGQLALPPPSPENRPQAPAIVPPAPPTGTGGIATTTGLRMMRQPPTILSPETQTSTLNKPPVLRDAKGRFMTLQKSDRNAAAGMDTFDVNDPSGKSVASIVVTPRGKTLNIEGIYGPGSQKLGTGVVRDALRQLKAQYPDVETITGNRVTGARRVAGTEGKMKVGASDWIKQYTGKRYAPKE